MESKGSSRADARRLDSAAPPAARDIRDALIIKQGSLFLVADLEGNVPRGNRDGLGMYLDDTRVLSAYELTVVGLRSTVLLARAQAHYLSSHVLTNPNLVTLDGELVHEQTIQMRRHRLLFGFGMRESVYFESFNVFPIRLEIIFHVDADFIDMFEVRGLLEGVTRDVVGVDYGPDTIMLSRIGVDEVQRRTTLRFAPAPDRLCKRAATFELELPAHGSCRIDIEARVGVGPEEPSSAPVLARPAVFRRPAPSRVRIETSSGALNAVLEQARRDLDMLASGDPSEPYLAAGTPWYATLFGRDSILAALEDLWIAPDVARDTLRLLARHQGRRVDPWRDEEPGKILHELRRGDVSRRGLVPFHPYYGTVDATPLWIVLLGEHYRSTADEALVRELSGSLDAALSWIDDHGDVDGDGFVEYVCRSTSGLANQGWKDSWDGVMHADGSPIEAPVALVEAQGYVYAAKRHAAKLYEVLGDGGRAMRLEQQAATLRAAFDDAFWMPGAGTYCLALDGNKRQAAVVASNAGHALFSGIVPPARAAEVARRLMQEDMFCGWGIRTLSSRELRYNPAGYHVGTVWPHDNAIIALGFARYGETALLADLVTGMFEAVRRFPAHQTPELFCGFAWSTFGAPVRYPVACHPQAWAAASWSAFLRALLGIRVDALAGVLHIVRPTMLPSWLSWVSVRGIPVGAGTVDLRYERYHDHTGVEVMAMHGDARVDFTNQSDV